MRYNEEELETIWDKCLEYKIQQKKEEWMRMLDIINNMDNSNNIIEIGAYDGGASISLKYFAKNMVTIDLSRHFNLSEFSDINYKNIVGNSHDGDIYLDVKNFIGNCDILFIDGDHSYEGVKKDYLMYKDLVNPGGIIAFHDIIRSHNHEIQNCFVHNLWDEIKINKNVEEIIFPDLSWGGIGIIYV